MRASLHPFIRSTGLVLLALLLSNGAVYGSSKWLARQATEAVGPARIAGAVDNGARYLLRSLQPDGRFTYSYFADSDSTEDTYNIVRHAGTVYALLSWLRERNAGSEAEGVRPAITYLSRAVGACDGQSGRPLCVVEDGRTKVGANALAILALVEFERLTHDTTYSAVATGLAERLVSIQSTTGQFRNHVAPYPVSVTDEPSTVVYYDAQASLALAVLGAHMGDRRLLESAGRGIRWAVYRGTSDVLDDVHQYHWLLYAIDAWHTALQDTTFVAPARTMVDRIVRSQRTWTLRPADIGTYGNDHGSAVTATKIEGLMAAHHTFRQAKDARYATLARRSAQLGAHVLLDAQITPDDLLSIRNPGRALGGVGATPNNPHVRIDYVQHFMLAMMGLRSAIRDTTSQ
jgi:hypothetical protein